MKNVILYGAGNNAKRELNVLQKNKEYNVICFCDSDISKSGTTISGVPVIHKSELKKIADNDVLFYITPDEPIFYDIQFMLLREKICTKEQILNYQPDICEEPYYSCSDLRKVAIIHDEAIHMCCGMSGDLRNDSPTQKYKENISDTITAFVAKKNTLLQEIKDGRKNICSGCQNIKRGYWKKETEKIEVLAISTSVPCQLSCIYCDVRSNARNIRNNREYIDRANKSMLLKW